MLCHVNPKANSMSTCFNKYFYTNNTATITFSINQDRYFRFTELNNFVDKTLHKRDRAKLYKQQNKPS